MVAGVPVFAVFAVFQCSSVPVLLFPSAREGGGSHFCFRPYSWLIFKPPAMV